MKCSLLLLSFLIGINLQSQNLVFNWVSHIGSANGRIEGKSITTDAAGNIYYTGIFFGTQDFDPGPAFFNLSTPGGTGSFISKLDNAGNFIWAKCIGGAAGSATTANSIAVDNTGNIYIAGVFEGQADFDPGPAISPGTTIFPENFILKLDASGNFSWKIQFVGTESAGSVGISLAVDHSGYIYAGGWFHDQVDFDPGAGESILTSAGMTDIFITKFSANGDMIWVNQSGAAGRDECYDITIDLSGNILVTGMVDAEITGGHGAIAIKKLDQNGNLNWTRLVGGSQKSMDCGKSIVTDQLGNVYASGIFNGLVGGGLPNASEDLNIFISKFTPEGITSWVLEFGGTGTDESLDLAVDGKGDLYASLFLKSGLEQDPGNCLVNPNEIDKDVWAILKLNPNSSLIWKKQMGGAESMARGNSIIVDTARNLYSTGSFHGRIDFDPGQNEAALNSFGNFITEGNYDAFVQKLRPCLNSSDTIITITTCQAYTLNCTTHTSGGLYHQTISNKDGCDSNITLNLTIKTGTSLTNLQASSCNNYIFNGSELTETGNYSDTLVNSGGCDSIINLQLTILQNPTPTLGEDRSICPGETLNLFPGKYDTYLWQDGSIRDNIAVEKTGTYSVQVSNLCGSATDEVKITEASCSLHFPTAFSPNSDGKNDLFKALGAKNLLEFHLVIFNRWGLTVFETRNFTSGWPGTFGGKNQPTGMYIWNCSFKNRDSPKMNILKGTVLLAR